MIPPRDMIRERGQAVLDQFFYEVDQDLLRQLKSDAHGDLALQELATSTGIKDDQLLKELVDLGVTPESMVAIRVIPLVFVAWADGKVDQKERDAVLAAAEEYGLVPNSLAKVMLEQWMKSRPTSKLGDVWKHYIHAVFEQLTKTSRCFFRDEMHRRLNDVASASGGIFKVHAKSDVEKTAISDLMEVFDEFINKVPEPSVD